MVPVLLSWSWRSVVAAPVTLQVRSRDHRLSGAGPSMSLPPALGPSLLWSTGSEAPSSAALSPGGTGPMTIVKNDEWNLPKLIDR